MDIFYIIAVATGVFLWCIYRVLDAAVKYIETERRVSEARWKEQRKDVEINRVIGEVVNKGVPIGASVLYVDTVTDAEYDIYLN